MMRRALRTTTTALATVLAAGVLSGRAATQRKPNVVVILADDQGWGDVSIHGNRNLSTPNLDRLARQGALFERFYACPLCAPTRAEFLTGRYHRRGGVHGVSVGAERLNLDETTIADTFKAAGYATAIFGKWHNGTQYPYHPNGRGFDEFYGFTSGHWGLYFNPPLDHNGKLVRGKGFIIDDLTEHAMKFIEAHREEPFFCYLAYNTPHSPFEVPDRFYNKFKDAPIPMRHRDPEKEDLRATRCVLAMCENIDWNVGRLLRKLDALGLAENTIVVYFSDNGPNTWRWNGGMKGKKGSTDEGGVREPCFIRWPGRIRPGLRVPQIAGAIDLLPTLAEMAGAPLIGRKPLDGRSLKPLLLGAAEKWPDRMIFSQQGRRVSVRTQRYRMDNAGRLYDMVEDPGQRRNIAAQRPQIAARLRRALEAWRKEMVLEFPKDDRPFLAGYPEFPATLLPARDGVPHGGIRRSAPAPNCSFFTHWTNPNDSVTWDIQTATAGLYEAVLYYTCPAADVGSVMELSFLGRRVSGKVTTPHDPPLVGAQFDRVPRRLESYVKDFRPLRLGEIRLPAGRGQLTLRALKIPGAQAMDLRMVKLTLLKPEKSRAETPERAAAPKKP